MIATAAVLILLVVSTTIDITVGNNDAATVVVVVVVVAAAGAGAGARAGAGAGAVVAVVVAVAAAELLLLLVACVLCGCVALSAMHLTLRHPLRHRLKMPGYKACGVWLSSKLSPPTPSWPSRPGRREMAPKQPASIHKPEGLMKLINLHMPRKHPRTTMTLGALDVLEISKPIPKPAVNLKV